MSLGNMCVWVVPRIITSPIQNKRKASSSPQEKNRAETGMRRNSVSSSPLRLLFWGRGSNLGGGVFVLIVFFVLAAIRLALRGCGRNFTPLPVGRVLVREGVVAAALLHPPQKKGRSHTSPGLYTFVTYLCSAR